MWYMANHFNKRNMPSIALHAHSDTEYERFSIVSHYDGCPVYFLAIMLKILRT